MYVYIVYVKVQRSTILTFHTEHIRGELVVDSLSFDGIGQ